MPLDEAAREAMRRRVAGFRSAEARELEELRRKGPLTGEEALSFAIEVWELEPHSFEASDPVRRRGEETARAAWAKLRERLPWEASRRG